MRASLLLAFVSFALGTTTAFGQAGTFVPPPGLFPPLPPAALAPAENPLTPAKAVLGKMLFWDEQLSSDNTVACGTCHQPEAGGGDPRVAVNPGPDGVPGTPDDRFASPGVRRSNEFNRYVMDPTFGTDLQVTGRASPSMINAAFASSLFWDGRASSQFVDPDSGLVSILSGGALESQAVGPPLSGAEMSHDLRTWGDIVQKLAGVVPLKLATNLTPDIQAALAQSADYPALFQQAFGDPTITVERVAYAMASYQRTLVSDQSPWDLYNAGDASALSANQLAGYALFFGPAGCNNCHSAPLFADNQFHNLGLRPVGEDAGRQNVTGVSGDRGKFKTPTLRNSGLRPRFMHNGELGTMTEVNQLYAQGGGPFADNRSPLLAFANFGGPTAISQLNDFVANALTDPRVAQGLPPFDRPTLRSEAVTANNPEVGTATLASDGVAPVVIADSPANIGNSDFKVGVFGGAAFAPAWLVVSPNTATQTSGGVGIFVDVFSPDLSLFPTTLKPRGGGVAGDTLRFPIANTPVLIGYDVYAQWFIADPNANALGFAATPAVRVTVF